MPAETPAAGEEFEAGSRGQLKRLAELRAEITPEVEKQQAPALTRVAELEALRDLASVREREKGHEHDLERGLHLGRGR